MLKRYRLFVFLGFILILGAFVLLKIVNAESVLGDKTLSLLYVSSDVENKNDIITSALVTKGFFGKLSVTTTPLENDSQFHQRKEIFLSPDHKYFAVTVESYGGADTRSYISDLNGKRMTDIYPGSFKAWSPDSQKIVLYLSGIENKDGKIHIFYLNLANKYFNSGLPEGTIDADISPTSGEIVYSLSDQGGHSNLFVRDKNNHDKLLLSGSDSYLGWPRWALDGEKIVFLKYKADRNDSDKQTIWVIDKSDGDIKEISSVEWNYPPVLSADGSKVLFAHSNNIWQYDVLSQTLRNLSNLDRGTAFHPQYSSDQSVIFFTSDYSGVRQIWAVIGNTAIQLTDDQNSKSYPLSP